MNHLSEGRDTIPLAPRKKMKPWTEEQIELWLTGFEGKIGDVLTASATPKIWPDSKNRQEERGTAA